MYLVPASSTHYCSGEISSKLSHCCSHLMHSHPRRNFSVGHEREEKEERDTRIQHRNKELTASDMKARSGSSTMGESVPS